MNEEARKLLKGGGQAIAARYMPLIREHMRQGKLPDGWTDARDISVVRQMLEKGHDPSEIDDAIVGLRELVRQGKYLAGSGYALTMRALYSGAIGAMPVFARAVHEARKKADPVVRTA